MLKKGGLTYGLLAALHPAVVPPVVFTGLLASLWAYKV